MPGVRVRIRVMVIYSTFTLHFVCSYIEKASQSRYYDYVSQFLFSSFPFVVQYFHKVELRDNTVEMSNSSKDNTADMLMLAASTSVTTNLNFSSPPLQPSSLQNNLV